MKQRGSGKEEREKKKKRERGRERGKEREGAKCLCSVVCGRAFWFLSFYYNDISLFVLIISVKQISMFSFIDRDIVYFASTFFDKII